MDIIEVDSETKEMLKTLVSYIHSKLVVNFFSFLCVCRILVISTISKLLNSLHKVDMAEGNNNNID